MKINFELDEEYVSEEEMLAYLIIQSDVYLNNGWWFKNDNKPWQEDYTTLHVNCSDTFAYASADGEDLKYSEIRELYEFVKAHNDLGAMAWCIKKRKVRPLEQRCKQIDASGIWTIEELLK